MNAILDVLKTARDALAERRVYCPQWEYKYGKEWDKEDGAIRDAIAAMEAEKPAIDISDALIVAKLIAMKSYQDFYDDAKLIQQYAEAYHAKKCAEDRSNLEWLVYHSWREAAISISRGRELLGFTDMMQMREWLSEYEEARHAKIYLESLQSNDFKSMCISVKLPDAPKES